MCVVQMHSRRTLRICCRAGRLICCCRCIFDPHARKAARNSIDPVSNAELAAVIHFSDCVPGSSQRRHFGQKCVDSNMVALNGILISDDDKRDFRRIWHDPTDQECAASVPAVNANRYSPRPQASTERLAADHVQRLGTA